LKAFVWVVVNPEDPDTPVGGVWTTLELASAHCPNGYAILKLELDVNHR
jgi:hypothetical protein